MKELITWRATLNEWKMDDLINQLLSEAGRTAHKADGTFPAAGEKATTYSMSKSGAKRAGISDEYVGRGKTTASGKYSSPFGMNTSKKGKQCGRIEFPQGSDKSPTHSCKDYPKKYDEGLIEEDELIMDGDDEVNQIYWRSTIKQAIEDEVGKALAKNNCSLQDLMKAMNAWETAKKGKMNKDKQ